MTSTIFKTLRIFRWILPVFYLGLGVGLAVFALAFLAKLVAFAESAFSNHPLDNALALLGLIDAALIAGLTVMVMVSGFVNFVGQPDVREHDADPLVVGFAALKTKFAATIAAIGAVNLLEYALDTANLDLRAMLALSAVELVFVVLMVAFAWLDRGAQSSGH